MEHNDGGGWKSSNIRLANPQQLGMAVTYFFVDECIPPGILDAIADKTSWITVWTDPGSHAKMDAKGGH